MRAVEAACVCFGSAIGAGTGGGSGRAAMTAESGIRRHRAAAMAAEFGVLRSCSRSRGSERCVYGVLIAQEILDVVIHRSGNHRQIALHGVIHILSISRAAGACHLDDAEAEIYCRARTVRRKMDGTGTAVYIVLEREIQSERNGMIRLLSAAAVKGLAGSRRKVGLIDLFNRRRYIKTDISSQTEPLLW